MSAQTEKETGPNPYLNARREWNERYSSYINQRDQWRRLAFINGGIALVAVLGVVWIGSQSKIVPYLVEVTREGETVAGRVAQPSAVDERMIRYLLAGFVQDWRGVSVDAGVQRQAIERVYAFLSQSDSAYTSINTWYQQNQPYERAQKEVVTATIENILRTTVNSLQIEWVEETRDRRGNIKKTEKFKASVVIAIVPPTKEEMALRNPTGLYVKELQFSQRLN